MKHKRTLFVVNPSFQFKVSGYLSALVFLTSAFCPLLIFYLLEASIEGAMAASPETAIALGNTRVILVVLLVSFQLLISTLVFGAGIYFTHKIAGPLFKLEQTFHRVAQGEDPGELYFRKGDYFPELATAYNKAHAAMLDRMGREESLKAKQRISLPVPITDSENFG